MTGMTKNDDRLTIRLGAKRTLGLKILAVSRGLSQNQLLNNIVEYYLEDKGRIVLAIKRKLELGVLDRREEDNYTGGISTVRISLSPEVEADLRGVAVSMHISLEGLLRLLVDDHLGESVVIQTT